MRIQVILYDASGQRIGKPIKTATSASVTRALDGAGSISISLPGTDETILDTLQNEVRARIFVEEYGRKPRELGRGILRNLDYVDEPGGWSINASGPDGLDELKRRSVKYNRTYSDQTVAAISTDLVGLVPGWSVSSSLSQQWSGRLDGVSVLKALQAVAEAQGVHFRQVLGSNVVEVGAFGSDAGVTLVNKPQFGPGLFGNDEVALIESFKMTKSSKALCNRLFGFGAGQNVDAALTLARSTRTSPYPILSEVVNGRRNYYIEDSASIAEYDVIEQDGQFKGIAPLSNTEGHEILAANTLYDAMAAWLPRYSLPQTSYQVTVRKCVRPVQQGDKVRIVYKGKVETTSGTVTYRNINGLFWVMKATERCVSTGTLLDLEVSDIDRYEMDSARIVLGAMEQIRLQGTNIQPSINHYTYGPEQVLIDPDNDGKVQLIITDKCFAIDEVLMRVRTQPFTATSRGAAAGGDHRHKMFGSTTADASGLPLRNYRVRTFDGVSFNVQAVYGLRGPDDELWTDESSGEHEHDPIYGIYKNTVRPQAITIRVNGVIVASAIGSSGSDLDQTIDITSAVKGKSGGFREAVHDVLIECTGGQGEVVVSFDVYEQITPAKFKPDS